MVLDAKNTTVAYRCPKCGAGVMSVVGLFNLSADMVKLKCDCGESEMSIVYDRDSSIRFTVPCITCPKPHQYKVSSKMFFSKDLFVLPCQYTGVNIAMMGDTNKVKAELARSELELIDMLEKAGIDTFDEIKGEQTLSDPQVLEVMIYVIKELDEEGRIRCRCTADADKEYDIDILDEALRVTCKSCGASKEISALSLIDAHEFLNADELILE